MQVKDDQEVIDFMYRLLAGLIFAVANTGMMSLNFYPILGELGTVSQRLAKICKWSPKLFKIISDGAQVTTSTWNRPEEIQDWLSTITDKDMGGNLRLFIQPYVEVPTSIYDTKSQIEERYVHCIIS